MEEEKGGAVYFLEKRREGKRKEMKPIYRGKKEKSRICSTLLLNLLNLQGKRKD